MTRNNLLGLSLLLACAAPSVSMAQTAYLEQSGIVGQGKLLTISRLPTANASGKISYYDGTINIVVSPAGVPSVGTSSFMMSKKLVTDHFVPGRYYVKYGNAATQFSTLTDGVGQGGSTIWSLVMDTSPDGNFPQQAVWQTGAPAPDVAARLNAAKVPPNGNYSYGTFPVGNHLDGCCNGNDFSSDDGLLAAEQVGQSLILTSYTDGDGHDQPDLTGSITLGLCTDKACSNAPM